MGVYHSQTTTTVRRVTHGYRVDRRAQFRYTSTYNDGADNTGTMRDYNTRTEALTCTIGGNRRWYIGYSREADILGLERAGTRRPSGYALLLERFVSAPEISSVSEQQLTEIPNHKQSQWMWRQGIFSVDNLRYIWPNLANDPSALSVPAGWNAWNEFNPEAGAFDSNWLPDGSEAPDLPH